MLDPERDGIRRNVRDFREDVALTQSARGQGTRRGKFMDKGLMADAVAVVFFLMSRLAGLAGTHRLVVAAGARRGGVAGEKQRGQDQQGAKCGPEKTQSGGTVSGGGVRCQGRRRLLRPSQR